VTEFSDHPKESEKTFDEEENEKQLQNLMRGYIFCATYTLLGM
jgi:hypothetical protein